MPSIVNLKLASLALAVLGCFSSPLFAQDGIPDVSFGTGGMVVTAVNGTASMGTSLAIQADNKIILGGTATVSSNQYFGLVRYFANGNVDSSFGVNGRVVAGFNEPSLANLTAIKLQEDGKIVAVGNSGSVTFSIIRFNTDGTVDSTFGVNGRVVSNINGQPAYCNALAIQADGRIVVAGSVGNDIGLCRYKTDGTFDSTFGNNGIKIIDAGGSDKAYAVVIRPDNKIVVGGSIGMGAVTSFLIIRCKANGNIDAGFGTGGQTSTLVRQTYNVISSCTLQPDGKIVAGGIAKYFNSAYSLVRYNANGKVDSSFGVNGISIAEFSGDHNPKAIALQADGKIVQAGWINDGGTLEIAMVRYTTNGSIDSSFGINGKVITNNANGIFGNALAIQSDNKILVGGYTYIAASGNYFSVNRYNITSVLPVKLFSFTAAPAKSTVLLNWVTTSEQGSSYFNIERSGDSRDFASIGRVESKGNSSQLQQYAYTDVQPLNGDNFYRLKQVDKNGRYSYSKTVHVVFGVEPYIKAYPNPAKNTVKVSGLGAGATLAVTGMTGKAMGQYTSTGAEYTINIQNLPAGIYFIRVQQGGKTTTLKLVKE